MPVVRPTLTLVTLILAAGAPLGTLAAATSRVDFTRDIQPLLSDACYHCHGPDASSRKSGLRLDRQDAALAGGKSGLPAVVPGKPDSSELIARILSDDPEEVMPSPDSHKVLTAAQKDLLRRWVAEGAEWKEHWAYVAPKRPVVPEVSAPSAARIDSSHRRLYPGSPRSEGHHALTGSSAGLPAAPALARSRRPAALPGRRGSVRARRPPRRLRAPGRTPARLTPPRRALGPPVARCRPLRGLQRLFDRRTPADLEVPRLGRRRPEPGSPL
jgi:hypothetical protein